MGSSGGPEDNYCLNDGPFRKLEYYPADCDGHADPAGTCCLRRFPCVNNDPTCDPLDGVPQIINIIVVNEDYGSDAQNADAGFRSIFENSNHDLAHPVMGGMIFEVVFGHLATASSPDDPIFYLLHSFVDFIWAVWQDCHDYDLVNRYQITDQIYVGTQDDTKIDDPLHFKHLADTDWAFYRRM